MIDRHDFEFQEHVGLWIVKISLALILAGMLIVGYRNGIWPIINWPMYARPFVMPGQSLTAVRIDVVLLDGSRESRLIRELAPIGEHNVVTDMVYCTRDETDPDIRHQCASAIVALAEQVARSRAPQAVELWELKWDVDARALPPLDKYRPRQTALIGRLEVEKGWTVDR